MSEYTKEDIEKWETQHDRNKFLTAFSSSNLPRNFLNLEEMKDFPPGILDFVSNLEDHFVAGTNLLVYKGDSSARRRCISWIGIQALKTTNYYFRSFLDRPGDNYESLHAKPFMPYKHGIPFTVRCDLIDSLTTMKKGDEEAFSAWCFNPDIFIIPEVGSERANDFTSQVLDEILRHRENKGLMTIISISRKITDDAIYRSETRRIVSDSLRLAAR